MFKFIVQLKNNFFYVLSNNTYSLLIKSEFSETNKVRHKTFHLVSPSPLPMLTSYAAYYMLSNLAVYMQYKNFNYCVYDLVSFLFLTVALWFRAIILESNTYHTPVVQKGLQLGFVLFIFSEVMVFFGLFWAFFAFSLNPSVESGCVWPPRNIELIDPYAVPLLNTLILLTSGFFVTFSHHYLIKHNYILSIVSLICTLVLAVQFTLLQLDEYKNAPFTISESVYGSVFYMLTGCHGLHVIIGTIFLGVGLFRLYAYYIHKFSNYDIT
jgi:cytochrome c oxidase subunit 3